jgi:oxygen-independent coproporphyrinogen-3 oxidase
VEFGAYVHIPWCRARCPYCAFAIDVRRARPHAAYADAVLRDWRLRRPAFSGVAGGRPSTVFFGGGTPSLAPPQDIARMLEALEPLPGAEISLEANPHDLTDAVVRGLREAGITRLSVGVQSFQRPVAARLGRRQDAQAAPAALARARAAFPSLSLDLIFGAPGQEEDAWDADLAAALSVGPDHVSLYGLTIEEGSPFEVGGVQAADDDRWRAMYDRAVDVLSRAGLERYEVSNFARPGHRCRHNEHYWLARPWVGLGASAHGWEPDTTRTVNLRDVDAYVAASDGCAARERPAPEVLATELIGSGVRHVDGLARSRLRALTGLDVRPDAPTTAALHPDPERLRLKAAAVPLADAVAARLSASLRPSASIGA